MTKYLLVFLLALTSVSSFAKKNTEFAGVGEKNAHTSNDPCQAPEVMGCGPCYKACLAQQEGELRNDKSPRSSTATRSSKQAPVSRK